MRVLRGRDPDLEADLARIDDLRTRTAETGERALRVWTPHQHVSFGRRDTRAPGYGRAREVAAEAGFPPIERSVGGRPVAYTGTTVAVALVEPIEDVRTGLAERYEAATEILQRALWDLGAPVQRGEPDAAFCPGNHSLSFRGKVAGLGQRVGRGAATVGAVVIVADHEEVAGVLAPVYEALGLPLDPVAVGSVERAGGRADPETVVRTVESAFVETVVESADVESDDGGERDVTYESVDREV